MATDTVFSDTPAIYDGTTIAQFFVGKDTLVCDAYGIKSQKQFINTLCDNIKTKEAMDTIITDGGKYEISKKVADLLWTTEKNESSHQRHKRQHNDAKVTSLGSLLGVPVVMSNGIAVQTNKKHQSNLHTKSLWAGCLGGPAWGTEPEQLSTGVVCWNSIRINMGLI